MHDTIVITGDLTLGFTFVGPFDDYPDALDYANNVYGRDWKITTIRHPAGYVGEPGDNVLVVGNPLDGFKIVGTFDTPQAAANWVGYVNLLAGPMRREQFAVTKLEAPGLGG